ncbi:MAG: LytR C-terminal domain-containing protein [bacterium]
MPRRKAKKKKKDNTSGSQRALFLVVGLVLILCAASVAVGVKNRYLRPAEEDLPRVRLEVLNGTGEKGLARDVALALIKKNIDVFHVGNADRFDYESTVLIARKKTPGLETVSAKLGCGEFIEQLQADAMVDGTLIIGADFRTLNLGREFKSGLPE